MKLQLVATGQVYVCLVNGTGKALIPGLIYNAGQPIPAKTAPQLLLTLGNNAVQMKVNGKTVPVSASAGSIGYELVPGGGPAATGGQAATLRMSATTPLRAGILITGTEVLTGIISDRNGPWLSERLLEVGVDAAMIQIVGDRPEDLLAALRFMRDSGLALIVTSGGLGPTADDLTARSSGASASREMVLDEALEARIAAILEPLMKRWPDLDLDAVPRSNRKQAVIPAGSTVLDPVGTAPGLVVPPAHGSEPDRRRPARAAARASADVGDGARYSRLRRRDRGGDHLPARDPAPVRDPGVRDRQHAAGREAAGLDSTRSRSPPACAAVRSRSPPAMSRPPRPTTTRYPSSSAIATRTPCSRWTGRPSTSRSRGC